MASDVEHRTGRFDRPAPELVKDLSTQLSTLVRQELELARLEMTEKGRKAGVGAGMIGGGGLLALYGVGALVAAAILGLATVLDGWLAAIIVGVVLLAIAGILALVGKNRATAALPPMPEQAIESARRDEQAVAARVKEARS
jgi:MFS family permease